MSEAKNPELVRLGLEFEKHCEGRGGAARIVSSHTRPGPYGGFPVTIESDTGCQFIKSPYRGGVTMVHGDTRSLPTAPNSLKLRYC